MEKQIVITTTRDAELLRRARLTNADLFRHEVGVFSAYHPRKPSPKFQLHWDALILDEAAQATEVEALLPLLVIAPPFLREYVLSDPQVVMVGDQNQLGPRTASKKPELQTSLFERLLRLPIYRDHPLARAKQHGGHVPRLTSDMLPLTRPPFTDLVRNYRSHPAILAIPSSLFYHDTLEPHAEDTESLLAWPGFEGRDVPVLFHDNRGQDEIEQDGGGWFNLEEAEVAIDHAESFIKLGVLPRDICIMSPFRAQVKVLRNKARARLMASVNIGPLEAYQGLEFRVAIVCTTRSRHRFIDQDLARGLGVIHESKRFNVALTRAQHALVVVGNPEALDEDEKWAAFLAFC
jgi:helicase MOV-10